MISSSCGTLPLFWRRRPETPMSSWKSRAEANLGGLGDLKLYYRGLND